MTRVGSDDDGPWFIVGKADGPSPRYYVFRVDKETFPKAVVVSGPWSTVEQARQVRDGMRATGSA